MIRSWTHVGEVKPNRSPQFIWRTVKVVVPSLCSCCPPPPSSCAVDCATILAGVQCGFATAKTTRSRTPSHFARDYRFQFGVDLAWPGFWWWPFPGNWHSDLIVFDFLVSSGSTNCVLQRIVRGAVRMWLPTCRRAAIASGWHREMPSPIACFVLRVADFPTTNHRTPRVVIPNRYPVCIGSTPHFDRKTGSGQTT